MLISAVILLTSVALTPVAEASVAREIPAVSVMSVSTVLDAPPLPFIGPEPAAGSAISGFPVLQQLAAISAGDVHLYVESNTDAIAAVLAAPPATRDVMAWWKSMDADRRSAVRAATPQLVGNLEGVPYQVRNLANRAMLSSTIARLEATIGDEPGRTIVENAKQQLNMLTSIDAALGAEDADARRTLMTLDVDGQGRAAVVLGDLRSADYVSYLVPGMFFTIENQMEHWTEAAARLQSDQLEWLSLLQPGDSRTVATVAWIGYHTPNLTNVGGIDNAYEGRDALADAIEGLQSIRTDDEPYVTVIAHSYGSTAALMALSEYDFEIDALAMVGSPGSPAKSVDDLNVRGGNVYVGEAAWDPIPNSAYFGSDPGSPSYGARPLGVGGGTDGLTNEILLPSTGHNEYFAVGTEAMRNFALIGIARGEYVTDRSVVSASGGW